MNANFFKKISIALTIIAIVLFGFLIYSYINSSNVYPEGTKINGFDCSNMNPDQASKHLTNKWNSNFYLIKSDDIAIGRITNLDFTYDISSELDGLLKPSIRNFWSRYVSKSYKKQIVPMKISHETDSFSAQFKTFLFLDQKKGTYTKSRNAFINMRSFEFPITKEYYGTEISKDAFKSRVFSDIAKGSFVLDYNKEDYYKKPEILSNNESLLEQQKFCKENFSQRITYELGEKRKPILPITLSKIIYFDDQDNKQINEVQLKKYVLNLARNINTFGGKRVIDSPGSGKFEVSGGNYGYVLNKEKEADQLKKDLLSGKDLSRQPIYSITTPHPIDNDLGNSYVDISLSRQRLWLIIDGEVSMSCNIISGNINKNYWTPSGTFAITYKERNSTLNGRNSDGTRYASPVAYWMPFNGNIGMHDAPWQSSFGGSLYLVRGSHGCINMPYYAAREVYSKVNRGFPVVVH
ncbi:MAG: L,D-transpeptidase family protein [Anaerovoracaceae bacterium]